MSSWERTSKLHEYKRPRSRDRFCTRRLADVKPSYCLSSERGERLCWLILPRLYQAQATGSQSGGLSTERRRPIDEFMTVQVLGLKPTRFSLKKRCVNDQYSEPQAMSNCRHQSTCYLAPIASARHKQAQRRGLLVPATLLQLKIHFCNLLYHRDLYI